MCSSGFLTTLSTSEAHDCECEDMPTNKGCKTLFQVSVVVRYMIMLSFNDTRAYEVCSPKHQTVMSIHKRSEMLLFT